MTDTQTISPVLLLKDPLVGTRLGEYEVVEPIGEGGMGVVYRAVHPLIKKRVAIKVLKPGAATDAAHVKRLIAEAEAVNAIGHRHIVDIFGLGQLDDGRPYIVMELLDGEPLDAYLARNTKLPLHEVLTLLLDIAAPLAAAHAKGVIHRDLKPSNVFLCKEADGGHYVKLLDFGLAKKAMGLDGSSAQTSQHVVAGTPDYMSPEQARAMPVSARSDLYAFGVMAYELLSGEVPYGGLTPMDVMMAHVGAAIPSVAKLVPSVPPALDALVQRLMSKDPAARPASLVEVRAELKTILASLTSNGAYQKLEPAPDKPSISLELPVVRGKVTEYPLAAEPAVSPAPAAPAAPTAPATATPDVLEPATGRSGSRVVPVIGALVLVALVAVGVVAMRPPSPEPVEPGPLVTPEPQAVKVEPTKAAENAEPVAKVEPTKAAPPNVEPVAERPPELRPTPPVTPPRRAPSAEQLQRRVERMRKELERLTPRGETPDPSAEKLLGKYKLQSFAVESAAERAELERSLNTFERQFLNPKRRP